MRTLAVLALILSSLTFAGAGNAPSDSPGVILIELFTSEGCSSCPPADALLREVNGTRARTGQVIVGISEHVTYWNGLGWNDPFSSPANTQRQKNYSDRFHLEGVYTPQMVINGSKQIVGSDRAALAHAIEDAGQAVPRLKLHIVSLTTAGDMASVAYSASGELPAQGADLIAVVADDADRSSVLHGENSGETLLHVFVARSLARVATLQAGGEKTVQIRLPAGFQRWQKHHLILFAQTPRNGPVLAADSKPL